MDRKRRPSRREPDRQRLLEGETGAVIKDHGGRLRVALCYPNTYYVGMSSLGLHAVYYEFNRLPHAVCERAFYPDGGSPKRPLRTLESGTPLASFDIVAFSVAFELDYVRMVRMLAASGIPPRAAERDGRHPLVLAGGACATFNPEPIAEIVDACAIGEAEEIVPELVAALSTPADRPTRLEAIAQVGGVYVPSLYRVEYVRGELARVDPTPPAPLRVARRYVEDLDSRPAHTRIFTRNTEFGRMFLLETARGCGRGCRFCVADHAFRPARRRSLDSLVRSAEEGLRHRDTVGLIAPSVTDHKHIDDICRAIVEMGGRVSVASLRADSVTEPVLRSLAESGARTVTIAPEAGTQRLRDLAGKRIDEPQYMWAAQTAASLGIRRLKLYFMIGLPTESGDDVAAIHDFARRIRNGAGLEQVTVSCAPFVPKPRTPWERREMLPPEEVRRRLALVRSALAREPWARFASEGAWESFLQAALARGDRRLGQVLVEVARTPGRASDWRGAFSSCALDPAWFALRRREPDELLPWAHIG